MNNTTLFDKLKSIARISNPLDAYLELKKLQKDYRKSDFYKQTRMPLKQVYKMVVLNGLKQVIDFVDKLQDPIQVGNLITEYIDSISTESIDELFGKLDTVFNIKDLKEVGEDLQKSIDKLKF